MKRLNQAEIEWLNEIKACWSERLKTAEKPEDKANAEAMIAATDIGLKYGIRPSGRLWNIKEALRMPPRKN